MSYRDTRSRNRRARELEQEMTPYNLAEHAEIVTDDILATFYATVQKALEEQFQRFKLPVKEGDQPKMRRLTYEDDPSIVADFYFEDVLLLRVRYASTDPSNMRRLETGQADPRDIGSYYIFEVPKVRTDALRGVRPRNDGEK